MYAHTHISIYIYIYIDIYIYAHTHAHVSPLQVCQFFFPDFALSCHVPPQALVADAWGLCGRNLGDAAGPRLAAALGRYGGAKLAKLQGVSAGRFEWLHGQGWDVFLVDDTLW